MIDKINGLAADAWQVDQIVAPLTTGWISPGGRVGATSVADKVHYLAVLRPVRAGCFSTVAGWSDRRTASMAGPWGQVIFTPQLDRPTSYVSFKISR